MTKRTASFALAAAVAVATLVSCNKDQTSKISSGGVALTDEKVFTGTCTAFGIVTEEVPMYYVAEEDVYYLAYYYYGNGSFDFKWDKATGKLSVQECSTGLFYGFCAIDALSQDEYEQTLGAEAKPSYYDPVSKTFTFNILYQTADEAGDILQIIDEVTYVVKE